MGLEEYIPSVDGATFIEWPQMAQEAMPESVLEVEIVYAMDGLARSLTMTGTGDFDMARLEALEGMLEELHEDSDD